MGDIIYSRIYFEITHTWSVHWLSGGLKWLKSGCWLSSLMRDWLLVNWWYEKYFGYILVYIYIYTYCDNLVITGDNPQLVIQSDFWLLHGLLAPLSYSSSSMCDLGIIHHSLGYIHWDNPSFFFHPLNPLFPKIVPQ